MRIISSIAVLFAGVAESSTVCSEDIIRTADSQGFLLSVLNCMSNAAASPGPETCLSRFIGDNAVGNPFPITDGACRDAYRDMLTQWLGGGIHVDCPHLDSDDPIPFSCANVLIFFGMIEFRTTTGFFPSSFCSAAEVRARARNPHYFATIVPSLIGAISYTDPQDVACDYCYGDNVFQVELFTYQSGTVAADNPAVFAGCTDPAGPNEDCMRSTTMIDARRFFAACAGYDILFEGPVCSANQIAMVEDLVPKPFYTFAYCAYNPRVPFCTTIDAYVTHIEKLTSVDCVACYTELNTDLAELALLDKTGICSANVLSDSCLTYVASALTNFESCSGLTIGTVSAE